MRFPWIQVDADGRTRGRMLGRLLGVGPHAGIGIAVEIWSWALEMSQDGDFSGVFDTCSIAAGVDFSTSDPDVERLARCLVLCGIGEMPQNDGQMPVTGKTLRIRGLKRYSRVWEKNSRRKNTYKMPVTGDKPAKAGDEPAVCAAEPARKNKKYITTLRESRPAPDPRIAPLTETMVAIFRARRGCDYHHGGAKDAVALKALLATADEEEIARRWAVGLIGSGYNSCNTFAELRAKWNNLSTASSSATVEAPLRML